MTTIAFDGKTIAADSRCTQGTVLKCDTMLKLDKVDNGRWKAWAWSGNVADLEPVILWVMNGMNAAEQPKVNDFGALLVDHAGAVWELEPRDGLIRAARLYPGELAAFGSGAPYAYAAMKLGNPASQAVQFASTIDLCTGGPIRVYDLSTGEITGNG